MRRAHVQLGWLGNAAYFVLMPIAFALLMWLWTCLWIPIQPPF